MPIHDWTRVDAGIFHHFHQSWIPEVSKALNDGVLPASYYALAEQTIMGPKPDVITLQRPLHAEGTGEDIPDDGGIAVASAPPVVTYHTQSDEEAIYAQTADVIMIRHRSGHDVVAIIEIVSPGNKSSERGVETFVKKIWETLQSGVHVLIVDLFPPGPRDPGGIHPEIWAAFGGDDFRLPPDKQLTLASYVADTLPEGYIEPVGLGDSLPDMPIFLQPGRYVPVPLEETYERAWEAVPEFWRNVIVSSGGDS